MDTVAGGRLGEAGDGAGWAARRMVVVGLVWRVVCVAPLLSFTAVAVWGVIRCTYSCYRYIVKVGSSRQIQPSLRRHSIRSPTDLFLDSIVVSISACHAEDPGWEGNMHHHGTRRVPRWCPIGVLNRCRRERYTDSERVSKCICLKSTLLLLTSIHTFIHPPPPRATLHCPGPPRSRPLDQSVGWAARRRPPASN